MVDLRLTHRGKNKKIFSIWLIYTLLLAFGLTVIPPSMLFELEKVTAIAYDPNSYLRHMLSFTLEAFLSKLVIQELALPFSIILGASTELVQVFIPWRSYDVLDLTADIIGSIIGVSMTKFMYPSER